MILLTLRTSPDPLRSLKCTRTYLVADREYSRSASASYKLPKSGYAQLERYTIAETIPTDSNVTAGLLNPTLNSFLGANNNFTQLAHLCQNHPSSMVVPTSATQFKHFNRKTSLLEVLGMSSNSTSKAVSRKPPILLVGGG